jgi:hypothetical protein
MLDRIIERQLDLQVRTFGTDPARMDPDSRAIYIADQALGAHDEISEALEHIGWKSWAESRHFHREDFASEAIDLLMYTLNFLLVAGMSAEDIDIAHAAKVERVAARQREGYKGVRND